MQSMLAYRRRWCICNASARDPGTHISKFHRKCRHAACASGLHAASRVVCQSHPAIRPKSYFYLLIIFLNVYRCVIAVSCTCRDWASRSHCRYMQLWICTTRPPQVIDVLSRTKQAPREVISAERACVTRIGLHSRSPRFAVTSWVWQIKSVYIYMNICDFTCIAQCQVILTYIEINEKISEWR